MQRPLPRILVDYQGQWGLGDLLCSEPMVRALRERHGPEAEIRWRGNAGNAAFSPAFNGRADDDFVADETAEITLFDRMPHAQYGRLEALPSLVDHMCAYAGVRPADRQPQLHLGPSEHWFLSQTDLHLRKRPLVAICADDFDRYRSWPVGHYFRLANEVLNRGGSLIELGVKTRLGVGVDLVGKLDIRQTAAVLSSCDLFIGNNSGLFHYAQAADVPCLVFFSLALPERFIHDDRLVLAVQRRELPCIDCMTKDFADRNRNGCQADIDAACMRELPLETGLAALDRMFTGYLAHCPRRNCEATEAVAFRAAVYADNARRLIERGHHERAADFVARARDRLAVVRTSEPAPTPQTC